MGWKLSQEKSVTHRRLSWVSWYWGHLVLNKGNAVAALGPGYFRDTSLGWLQSDKDQLVLTLTTSLSRWSSLVQLFIVSSFVPMNLWDPRFSSPPLPCFSLLLQDGMGSREDTGRRRARAWRKAGLLGRTEFPSTVTKETDTEGSVPWWTSWNMFSQG